MNHENVKYLIVVFLFFYNIQSRELLAKELHLEHAYSETQFHHNLYPDSAPPLKEDYLRVSDLHTIFYATYGNSQGIPVLILHGGPGEGCSSALTRFFDLSRYYVIMFDQRGSKRSMPLAMMEENTPQNSIEDIETLRKQLGIKKWLLFGASWGSTLAILYGQAYPENCSGFVLRSAFLARDKDSMHLLYGMGELSPRAYEEFINHLPEKERSDIFQAYLTRIMSPDPNIYIPASRAFIKFDVTCARFFLNEPLIETVLRDDVYVYSVAKHFFHYTANNFFIEKNQILSNMHKIKHLPAIIIHGKFDIVTLPENAFTLYKNWDNSVLWIVPQGGHSSMEQQSAAAIASAFDLFAQCKFKE